MANLTEEEVMPAKAGIQVSGLLDSRLKHAGMTRGAAINCGTRVDWWGEG